MSAHRVEQRIITAATACVLLGTLPAPTWAVSVVSTNTPEPPREVTPGTHRGELLAVHDVMDSVPTTAYVDSRETPPHHILVCVDRSAFASVCMRYALSFATALGSGVTIAHVLEPHRDTAGHTDALDWEIARQEAATYLERLRKESARAIGRPVTVRLEQGHPSERIVELARELHADLTVIGSHGEGGVTPWTLGSTAQQVIAASRGSVFIAHHGDVIAPRRILVPLDGSRRTECVLPTASRIARAYGAELVLAHVVHQLPPTLVLCATEHLERARELEEHMEICAKAYLEGLRVGLARDGAVVRTVVARHANDGQAIVETSKRERADLVIVAAHGTACDPERTFGSVTEYLLGHSHAPLLVLQDLPDSELHAPGLDNAAPALRASFPPGLV